MKNKFVLMKEHHRIWPHTEYYHMVVWLVAVDKYKNQTAERVKKNELNTPKVISANPLDNLDCKKFICTASSLMC